MLIILPRVFSRFIFTIVLNTNPADAMKRRHETVRLSNLELLVAEAGSAVALARRASTSESYLSQIRNQLTTPKGTPRGVGDDLAAKLERAMGKPDGWMDEPHRVATEDHAHYNAEPGPDVRSLHPLISWVQAGEWSEIAGNFELGDAEDLLPCPVRCSADTFVLRVRGESMEPKFHDGDLIFVDPQVAPVSGRYVVVRLEDSQEATFKQLIVEEGRQYLKALNPDWPHRIIEVNVDATICGVIVFKGELV
jgi:SOS-response transcriptional repressor LexA